MIDARHQGRGYGRQAMELLIDRIGRSGNARVLLTSHLRGDHDAGPFYRKLGFDYTGEEVDGDFIMELRFDT